MALNSQRCIKTSIFQFHLRHLFLLMFLQGVYFAMVRLTGPFVATILVGPFLQMAVIVLLRIESMVWGAIFGTIVAGLFLMLAAVAFGPVPMDQIIAAWLVYPIVGYLGGILCAADRQLRLGL